MAAGVSVVLGSFKLLMTLVAVLTVDSWGRRPLLLYGVSAMTVALLVLGESLKHIKYIASWPAIKKSACSVYALESLLQGEGAARDAWHCTGV